jgi:F-type H+-transporting ATPase subunit epsilon
MHIEIITPETVLFSGEATAVQLPGLDGSFQVLNNHAPIISGLKAGDVKVDLESAFVATEKTNAAVSAVNGGKVINVAIKGGVLEFQNNKMIVLAE